MKKTVLALLLSTAALPAMTTQKVQTLISLAPKCISFCEQTIKNYKANMLRASKEQNIKVFFEKQINAYEKIIIGMEQALNNQSGTQIYALIKQIIMLSYGNTLLFSLRHNKCTQKELSLVTEIKKTEKRWIKKSS